MRDANSPYLGWPGRTRLSIGNQLALTFYWFPSNVLWTGLLLIVIPAKVAQLVGRGSATGHLSLTHLVGDVVPVLAAPLFGAVSDRWRSRHGRRRPLMAIGVAGNIAFLLMMGLATNFGMLVGAYVGVQLFYNISNGAYQGLIPDLVPPRQRGAASGYMGLWRLSAIIVGALLATVLAGLGYYLATALLLAVGLAVTVAFVREPAADGAGPFSLGRFLRGFWISGPRYRDFWWVFGTRFLVMVGFYVLEYYLSYYLRYVLGIAHPAQQVLLILVLLTSTAFIAALLAGHLSDRLHRRRVLVTASGLLMGLCALIFVLLHALPAIYLAALLFGLGYGTYTATDYALVVDTLPSGAAARDMGIWGLSETLPQILAAALGLVMAAMIPHIGYSTAYRGLFGLTFLLFLSGSLFVWKVRSVA